MSIMAASCSVAIEKAVSQNAAEGWPSCRCNRFNNDGKKFIMQSSKSSKIFVLIFFAEITTISQIGHRLFGAFFITICGSLFNINSLPSDECYLIL